MSIYTQILGKRIQLKFDLGLLRILGPQSGFMGVSDLPGERKIYPFPLTNGQNF